MTKALNLPAPEEMRKLWIEALRSGEYSQGHYSLAADGGFCCLGVACDVLRKQVDDPKVARWTQDAGFIFEDDSHTSYGLLPTNVRTVFGLMSERGSIIVGPHSICNGESSLADWNDKGATFADIANALETKPEAFFR